ncbi:MAG: hypothetical protein Q9174_003685, partial [Haloplaca sp. 1 TL-2023]
LMTFVLLINFQPKYKIGKTPTMVYEKKNVATSQLPLMKTAKPLTKIMVKQPANAYHAKKGCHIPL